MIGLYYTEEQTHLPIWVLANFQLSH